MKRAILHLSFLLLLCSCKDKTPHHLDVDEVLKKYEHTDFSDFKNTYVNIRQGTFTSTIYMITKTGMDNVPPYFVTCNDIFNHISEINPPDVTHGCFKDYYTDDEIKALIYKFRKFGIGSLTVDSLNNVLLNPFEGMSRASFFRSQLLIKSDTIRLYKEIYTRYKGCWYINNDAKKYFNVMVQ